MIKLFLNNNTKKHIDDKFIQEVIKNDGILILSKLHKDYEEIRTKYPILYIEVDLNNFSFPHEKYYIYEMIDFVENIFNKDLVAIRTENAKEFKVVIN